MYRLQKQHGRCDTVVKAGEKGKLHYGNGKSPNLSHIVPQAILSVIASSSLESQASAIHGCRQERHVPRMLLHLIFYREHAQVSITSEELPLL